MFELPDLPNFSDLPQRLSITVDLPKTLDGRPMTPERADALAQKMAGQVGEMKVDAAGEATITPEQLVEWAAAIERAEERKRW